MKNLVLAIFALGGLPLAAQAQQTTLCTSMVTDNPSNPYTDGIVAVSETFPVEGSGDYNTAWKAHIEQKYPSKLQRTSQCSSPVDDPATAAQGRLNFINKWEAGFQTDLEPWRPQQQRTSSENSVADDSGSTDSGRDDANGGPSNGGSADAARPNRPAADRGAAAHAGAGAPLRFVLLIGLQPRAGDSVNPTCYSNVLVRSGPPGWAQGGSLPPGSEGVARGTVEGMKSAFIAACEAASGRKVTSQGDFQWMWNEFRDGESQIANARARYREDVTVNL